MTVLRDPTGSRRSASTLNWHPDGLHKVVVAYSVMAFQRQPQGMPLSSYVWDVASPNQPEAELQGPSQLVCAKFNAKDGNLVGGGQYNGQFTYFDTRKGPSPVDATPVDVCHRCGTVEWTGGTCCVATACLFTWRDGAQGQRHCMF